MRLRCVCQNCHQVFDVITDEDFPAGHQIYVEDLVGVDDVHKPSGDDLEYNHEVWLCKKCADVYNSDDDGASLGLLGRLVQLLFPRPINGNKKEGL